MKSYFLNQSVDSLPQDHKFNGIDLVKFLCAYLVCIIHVTPIKFPIAGIESSHISFWLQQCLCRVAVPFYFI